MKIMPVSTDEPTAAVLNKLRERATQLATRLESPECELAKPLFFEFAGSPKSGKSTIIGIAGHFFRRLGFRVLMPAEGVSLRTPLSLRDDWLAFNAWSGTYALRHILECSHEERPADLVF